MVRSFALAGLTMVLIGSTVSAQDAATRRSNKAIIAQEKEILNRVTQRIEWDKPLTGSTLRVEVQPGGMVLLKGSVKSDAAKARALDLVENTTGVTAVTDELAVVQGRKVIDAPTEPAPDDTPDAVDDTPPRPAPAPAPAPSASRVIIKP